MEKVMSVEERIRRAENIYNRRNGQYIKSEIVEEKPNKKKRKIVKKLFTQIFFCLTIYICFYAATNSEYVFSEKFREEMKTRFSKEGINETYLIVKGFINEKIFKKEEIKEENKEGIEDNANENEGKMEGNENGAEEQSTETSKEEIVGDIKEISTEDNKEEGVGGAEEPIEEISQTQDDAKYIKSKISFIIPVKGRVSSTFGLRNPTTSTVPKNHTGIDIAANEGTKIKSATDGVVKIASSQGDYGNHYKIEIEDVTIIYAHCKKLYLKEGDKVKQGQEIAEVGSTGNSTRTTFAF